MFPGDTPRRAEGARERLVRGCSVLLPLADRLPAAPRLPWLLTMISCLYLGLALAFVNTAPLLLGLVALDRRNQAYARQTALLGLAAFLGSLLGGLLPTIVSVLTGVALEQPMPYRYGLLVAGGAVIPALPALARIQPGTVPELPAPPAGVPGTRAATAILGFLSLIALVRVLQIAGQAVTSTFINLYLDAELRVPTAQIGVLLALGRLVSVPAALSSATLSARFGNRTVVIGAAPATAVGLLLVLQIVMLLGLPCALLALTLPGRTQQKRLTARPDAAPWHP